METVCLKLQTGHARARCNDWRVDGAVVGALIGAGGVVLGVRLPGEGDGLEDHVKPLKDWIASIKRWTSTSHDHSVQRSS